MPFALPEDRRSLIIMAKVAEQCERYDEMLVCMKRLVKAHPALSLEEKNLLSVAYKNIVGSRRTQWRTLAARETVEGTSAAETSAIAAYKKRIVAEIDEVCGDLFGLIDNSLVPAAQDDESKVFFHKLKADYHRYHVEVSSDAEQSRKAFEAYTNATAAAASLPHCSPIRLGLALNFSVFHYEIYKEQQKGYEMAKEAYDQGRAGMEGANLTDDEHAESQSILGLLYENLMTWTQALGLEKGEGDQMECEDM